MTKLPVHGTWNAQKDNVSIIATWINTHAICEIMCAITISVVVTPEKFDFKLSSGSFLGLWFFLSYGATAQIGPRLPNFLDF